MEFKQALRKFLLPELNRRFMIRFAIVLVMAYVFFAHICIPMRIRGSSMEPNWHDGGFTFCWCPRFLFREPRIGDVVMIRFAGKKIMMLKRIVATAGQTVEFRKGILFVDGNPLPEPYLHGKCDWHLPPRTVKTGFYYVVGDNRDTLMENHHFGETPRKRIMGGPLW